MPRRSLPFLAVSTVIFSLGLLTSSGDPEDPSKLMILSVLHRGDTYIASTLSGLYETSSDEKGWRKMPTQDSMPPGGKLAEKSASSPELIYYKGTDAMYNPRQEKGALFISQDAGTTWTASSLDRPILDAFVHPNGSLFVVTDTQGTTPPPGQNESQWAFTRGEPGVKYYEAQNLLVSQDNGQTWKDITPALPLHFGLFGIFRDPKHPSLVCVRSAEMNHTSRTFFYQADDSSYHWKMIPFEQWQGDRFPGGDSMWYPAQGCNGSDMPATLGNFFKYPYLRSGLSPCLPTEYLVPEKEAYQFQSGQPMPVNLATFCMFPDDHFTLRDTTSEKVYWGARIQFEDENSETQSPQVTELYTNDPDHAQKLAAYTNDPHLVRIAVDRSHPYQRRVDLRGLGDFSRPGKYRVQVIHIDEFWGSGGTLETGPIAVTVTP